MRSAANAHRGAGASSHLSSARLSANRVEGKVKNLDGKLRDGADVFVPDPLTDFAVTQNVILLFASVRFTEPPLYCGDDACGFRAQPFPINTFLTNDSRRC